MNKMIELIINSGNGEIIPANEILNIPFTKQILSKSVATKNDAPPPGYYIHEVCLLYTSPSPRDPKTSRMPSSA